MKNAKSYISIILVIAVVVVGLFMPRIACDSLNHKLSKEVKMMDNNRPVLTPAKSTDYFESLNIFQQLFSSNNYVVQLEENGMCDMTAEEAKKRVNEIVNDLSLADNMKGRLEVCPMLFVDYIYDYVATGGQSDTSASVTTDEYTSDRQRSAIYWRCQWILDTKDDKDIGIATFWIDDWSGLLMGFQIDMGSKDDNGATYDTTQRLLSKYMMSNSIDNVYVKQSDISGSSTDNKIYYDSDSTYNIVITRGEEKLMIKLCVKGSTIFFNT